MTNSVLQKLEWAFKLGASDREACNEANIAPQTLYNYQAANPDFLEQKAAWKSTPNFRARKAVVDALSRDPHLALKYLEKRVPEEFGKEQKLDPVTHYLTRTGSTRARVAQERLEFS